MEILFSWYCGGVTPYGNSKIITFTFIEYFVTSKLGYKLPLQVPEYCGFKTTKKCLPPKRKSTWHLHFNFDGRIGN